MTIQFIVALIIAALILVTGLLLAWHLRYQIVGLALLVACAYIFVMNDVFLEIRVPTICVVGIGVLLAVFVLIPRTTPNRKQKVANY